MRVILLAYPLGEEKDESLWNLKEKKVFFYCKEYVQEIDRSVGE
jgi:hypothetical protein